MDQTLTKREQIAAMLLQGMLANQSVQAIGAGQPGAAALNERLLSNAVQLTDMLIERLEKTEKNRPAAK